MYVKAVLEEGNLRWQRRSRMGMFGGRRTKIGGQSATAEGAVANPWVPSDAG